MRFRGTMLGLAVAGLIPLWACGPIPTVLDTPKNGDKVSLTVNQPMTVRWSNQSPAQGAWVLEGGPTTPAVTLVGYKTEQPAGAAMALDIFDFVAAQKGDDRLTFAYKRKDGTPPTADERITIALSVD